MFNTTTISALALAVTIISAPVQANVKQPVFDNNLAKIGLMSGALSPGDAFAINIVSSSKAAPIVVAWSAKSFGKKVGRGIKKGAKKVGKGAKKVASKVKRKAKGAGRGLKRFGSTSKKLFVGTGRQAGRALRNANRVIVPSEIRNGASKAYRTAKRKAKYVIKHPYGKRCKPNKFLQPVCSVYPKKRRVRTHDHRQK